MKADNELLNAVMTGGECAELFGLHESTVRVAIRAGRINGRKSGKVWLVTRVDALAQWGDRINIVTPLDIITQT